MLADRAKMHGEALHEEEEELLRFGRFKANELIFIVVVNVNVLREGRGSVKLMRIINRCLMSKRPKAMKLCVRKERG